MRNYNTYLKGMEKGNDEKLFFLNKLNLNNFDRVIDFGCGKGDILKACSKPGLILIGIDHDPIMIEYAQQNVPNASFYKSLDKDFINDKTLIIFSSVLHEVEDYWPILRDKIKGTGATIVIRDMRFNDKFKPIEKNDLAKIIRNSNPKLLADFIKHWDMKYESDMYHYLLKYSYVDNWDLEVKENYFSFNYDDIISLGHIVYEHNYTLEFKKNRVMKDFGIDLNKTTHTQMIIKLKRYCE